MEALITAIITALGTMATDIFSLMTQAAPVVLPIFAAILAVRVGLRFVRSITGR